jgi:hypothetical protein
MRFADLIRENSTIHDSILDLLTAMSGEGLDSVPLSALVAELNNQGIDIDEPGLFDNLSNLAIVRNIKDGIVYFNSDSDQSHYSNLPDPKKQEKQVSKLARKQVDKEIKK